MSIYAHYWWLGIGTTVLVSYFTVYSFILESIAMEGNDLNELTFILITALVNSVVAFVWKTIFGGTTSNVSEYKLLELVLASFCSTLTMVHSLKFVIYPIQILFKSFKVVPVRLSLVV
jgi:UDP-galactose transporter B1